MTQKPTWKVVRDGDGWGVLDRNDIFENQEPMTKARAEEFHRNLISADEAESANQRYWSQSCFGE